MTTHLDSMKDKLRLVRAERETLSKKIRQMAAEVFADGVKVIFEKHPTLEYISWTQYTPYFNDGEACEFSVNRDYLTIKEVGEEAIEDYDFDLGEITRSIETGTRRQWNGATRMWEDVAFVPTDAELSAPTIREFINEFEDADFLMMFGDHVRVTIYNDGRIEADHYDHD